MTQSQLKICIAIAQSDADLTGYDDAVLYGFGLPEFKPVTVAPQVVAKCIRWQCSYVFGGGFNWEQLNEDRPFYLRKVQLTSFAGAELRELQQTLAAVIAAKLGA